MTLLGWIGSLAVLFIVYEALLVALLVAVAVVRRRRARTAAPQRVRVPASAHVAVVGGGVAGLSAAYRLLQRGPATLRVTLLERAASAPGGQIASRRLADGSVLECGPRVRHSAHRQMRLVVHR